MFLNSFTLILSLAFVFEDEHLAGLISLVESPFGLAIILFFILILSMKWHVRSFYIFWTPTSRLLVQRYQNIEDRLYMEEYEDPEQQFEISDSVVFASLVK